LRILPQETIGAMALSDDGRTAATYSMDTWELRVAQVPNGKVLAVTSEQKGLPGVVVKRLQFFRDGSQLAAAAGNLGAVVVSPTTLKVAQTFTESHAVPIPTDGFWRSPSGRYLITRAENSSAIWSLAARGPIFRSGSEETTPTGMVIIPKQGKPCTITGAAFAADDSTMAVVMCRSSIVIFDPAGGAVIAEYKDVDGQAWSEVAALRISPHGRFLAASVRFQREYALVLWDNKTKTMRRMTMPLTQPVAAFAFDETEARLHTLRPTPEGPEYVGMAIAGGTDAQFRLTPDDCRAGSCVAVIAPSGRFVSVVSRDGKAALEYVDERRTVRLPRSLLAAAPPMSLPALSCDERRLVTGDRAIALYDVENAGLLWEKPIADVIGVKTTGRVEARFLCDGALLVLADGVAFRVALTDSGPGSVVRYMASTGRVAQADEVVGGNIALAGPMGIEVHHASTGHHMATLTLLNSGPWLVTAPSGVFDTDDIAGISTMSWAVAEDLFRPVSIETLMRQYFEPSLLPRVLAGEVFDVRGSLATTNPVQPIVEIQPVKWNAREGQATVTVRVARGSDSVMRGGVVRTMSSDAYDLRLFRDGQLVGTAPSTSAEWQRTRAETSTEDLARWRELTHVPLKTDGSALVTFQVRFPRNKDLKSVTWTAYAFNEDRIKSTTVTKAEPVPNSVKPVAGIAYIVTVGVNSSESPDWDLKYAANDARQLGSVVTAYMQKANRFESIVPIRLVSDRSSAAAVAAPFDNVVEAPATKSSLEIVLKRLAGRQLTPAEVALPWLKGVQPARPEDMVLLAISSHGYADAAGVFHLVLADIGPGQPRIVTPALDARTLSSDELSSALRGIDAGIMVLIVDACESESTVNADGFKPGPMGSRGLGQLAYDKGMRVLAASKAKESAIEGLGAIPNGLLTYALVHSGLENRRADFRPKDGSIWLSEWLAHAVTEVPHLFTEGDATGSIEGEGVGERHGFLGSRLTPKSYQQPVLFDFSKHDTLLASSGP
jgi:hypothetical protein